MPPANVEQVVNETEHRRRQEREERRQVERELVLVSNNDMDNLETPTSPFGNASRPGPFPFVPWKMCEKGNGIKSIIRSK